MGDLTAWLSRVVLDNGFRALAARDVDASFAGYALDDTAKDLLRRRDPRVLDLLGHAIRSELDGSTPRAESPVFAAPSAVVLPEISVILRISPIATQQADGSLQLSYQAAIEPLPPQPPLPPSPPDPNPTLSPHVPWVHRPQSAPAQTAAAAVRAAAASDRRDALLALADALKESW